MRRARRPPRSRTSVRSRSPVIAGPSSARRAVDARNAPWASHASAIRQRISRASVSLWSAGPFNRGLHSVVTPPAPGAHQASATSATASDEGTNPRSRAGASIAARQGPAHRCGERMGSVPGNRTRPHASPGGAPGDVRGLRKTSRRCVLKARRSAASFPSHLRIHARCSSHWYVRCSMERPGFDPLA